MSMVCPETKTNLAVDRWSVLMMSPMYTFECLARM